MLLLPLVVLAADLCDTPAPVPSVPASRDFTCPKGAELNPEGGGLTTCLRRDGTQTGDALYLTQDGGSVLHPDGQSVFWQDGAVTAFRTERGGKPVGPAVWRTEKGQVTRYELYGPDSKLLCGRVYEGGRLVRRASGPVWVWLDFKGKPIDPKVPLSKDELTSTAKEGQKDVRFCYERRLQKVQGTLEGTVVLDFDVKDGAVSDVELSEDTLRDPAVTDCMIERVKAWRFRPAHEATRVSFPFVLTEGK